MNRNETVDAWFDDYENPMKAGVMRVREIILGTDDRITESIKWKAPTFEYKGNIASFYPKAKKHVSLMFHQGAHIPGQHEILQGDGSMSRTAKFADLEEIERSADSLRAVIQAWCAMKDASEG